MNLKPDLNAPLLAIDTATPACSIALCHNGEITGETYAGKARHTEVILPMIDEFLRAQGLTVRELAGIIVGIGPGAFTGLRVGAAVASALAFAASIPVGKLSSLALLAAGIKPEKQKVLALLDARMGQCYAGFYQTSPLEMLDKEALVKPAALTPAWLQEADVIAGPGLVYGEEIAGGDAALLPDKLPDAKDAFAALPLVTWQSATDAIDLHYLRDDITQHD